MILARILLGTDSKVIPRQLLQFLRAPFFGIFPMTPSVQSLGKFFPSQMSVKSGWSRSAASCGCALNTSALRLSCPGDFLFLRDLLAAMISSFPGGSVLTSRSVSTSCISTSLGGGGLFRTSLKCSLQLERFPNYFVFSKIVFSAKNGFFRSKFSVNSAKIRRITPFFIYT